MSAENAIAPHVARNLALDAMARLRPALFINTFLTQLGSRGDEVLVRLFALATNPETKDTDALRAIDMILKLSNAQDVLGVAMGLKRQRGRPGSEDDLEAQAQMEEWGEVIELEESPPGSGNFEDADSDDSDDFGTED